jgi:hypothetical protein
MSEHPFRNQLDLEEEAEKLGKKAMQLGLIPSFVIRYFPDTWEFFIPNENKSDAFTPEEAYFHLKKLVEQSGK